MATTPSYSFNLPTVGSDTNTWGGLLNDNWGLVDDLLDGTEAVDGIDIDGGSIDGTPIGANAASTGVFTTLETTGALTASESLQVNIDSSPSFRLTDTGVRLGNGDASVALDLQDKTDAIRLPSGTTAQRPTGAAGLLRYNSTDSRFEGYADGSWGPIGGGAGRFKGENGVQDQGSGAGDIFRINEQELNTNVTIDASENASCAGPLTVASGVTLTVTSGGNLAIV